MTNRRVVQAAYRAALANYERRETGTFNRALQRTVEGSPQSNARHDVLTALACAGIDLLTAKKAVRNALHAN